MTLAIDASHWGWPQWTEVGLITFGIFMAAILDGKPRTGNHSAGVTLVSAVLVLAILVGGGFFA